MKRVLRMCSATDSLPEPRNRNPVRGVLFSMPTSNRKFAISSISSLLQGTDPVCHVLGEFPDLELQRGNPLGLHGIDPVQPFLPVLDHVDLVLPEFLLELPLYFLQEL